jgi:radical SAM superfamily enzyme YgiQ (UPF0313 family)
MYQGSIITMKTLLLYPRFFPSLWSMHGALELVGLKAVHPPLGLITVAAILPQTWEFKLVDCNIRNIEDAEWEWAELVIISSMLVQKKEVLAHIQEAKERGKRVAVGGPYPSALPQEVEAAGADYLILDEGEITLPLFVEAIEQGIPKGTFRANEKPDVTQTPIPRYDLLELDHYAEMSVQFSRGCPFQCEFCDIIVLFGRKPRTKTPDQLIQELECLYNLGWRGQILVVDDNFVGNKRNVKLMLQALKPWIEAKQYPFSFSTQASLDLGKEAELMELMTDCNFQAVFLGIETPDVESLRLTKEFQNTRDPLVESVHNIVKAGMQVRASFIIGFDGEKSGVDQRILAFIEETAIPLVGLYPLYALPNTALWYRLEKEGRLIPEAEFEPTGLMNFVPTRPMDEIAREYLNALRRIFDPEQFLRRSFQQLMQLGTNKYHPATKIPQGYLFSYLRGFITLLWRQGAVRKTRIQFWSYLLTILWHRPNLLKEYVTLCAALEHFLSYCQLLDGEITKVIANYEKTDETQIEDMPVKDASTELTPVA